MKYSYHEITIRWICNAKKKKGIILGIIKIALNAVIAQMVMVMVVEGKVIRRKGIYKRSLSKKHAPPWGNSSSKATSAYFVERWSFWKNVCTKTVKWGSNNNKKTTPQNNNHHHHNNNNHHHSNKNKHHHKNNNNDHHNNNNNKNQHHTNNNANKYYNKKSNEIIITSTTMI